jgi:hypothetical protein
MKVKCINSKFWYLTIGKMYDVINENDYFYEIVEDSGYSNWYHKEYFKPLSEIRNEKIDKLLE